MIAPTVIVSYLTPIIALVGIWANSRIQTKSLNAKFREVKEQAATELEKASLTAEQERAKLQQESRSRDLALAETIRDELREDIVRERTLHKEELGSQDARFQVVLKGMREDRDQWKQSYEKLWIDYATLKDEQFNWVQERPRLIATVAALEEEVRLMKLEQAQLRRDIN